MTFQETSIIASVDHLKNANEYTANLNALHKMICDYRRQSNSSEERSKVNDYLSQLEIAVKSLTALANRAEELYAPGRGVIRKAAEDLAEIANGSYLEAVTAYKPTSSPSKYLFKKLKEHNPSWSCDEVVLRINHDFSIVGLERFDQDGFPEEQEKLELLIETASKEASRKTR